MAMNPVHRLLCPGAVFAGSDGVHSTMFRLVRLRDTSNPASPDALPDRLRSIGFRDVQVTTAGGQRRWLAVKG
ncbi:hypothetical protein A5649_02380 [Mycolicibacter heraklionensis]|uniref:Methyltransferase n=1 Tax=Mycolicibacter heraklionensis TaxID=512402 RepID=A0AA91IY69_9MYCO|nr:hypothetical protein [Mycolicibacter heraklionensis]OBK85607.1 hypothetical protein A5649_02380 [Mycolicibacter heraklionensis]